LRNEEISGKDLTHYAQLMYGEFFNLYGLSHEELVKNNIAVLGRTIVECCVQIHSQGVAKKIDEYLKQNFSGEEKFVFVDAFGGSLNILYHIAERFGTKHRYIAYEMDPKVFETTSKNLPMMK
jgi:hypothetical protein